MKQLNPRTLTGLVAAAVLVAALAFGSFSSGADESSQASTQSTAVQNVQTASSDGEYRFRSNKLLKEHYDKHGKAMGFADAQAYLAGANAVIANTDSLHKLEQEDGDDVYYLQATDEIVFVSTDGYIRTYFNPGGIDYFNRQ